MELILARRSGFGYHYRQEEIWGLHISPCLVGRTLKLPTGYIGASAVHMTYGVYCYDFVRTAEFAMPKIMCPSLNNTSDHTTNLYYMHHIHRHDTHSTAQEQEHTISNHHHT